MTNKILVLTPEQYEILMEGMSAARVGLDSLVRNDANTSIYGLGIYSEWRESVRNASSVLIDAEIAGKN